MGISMQSREDGWKCTVTLLSQVVLVYTCLLPEPCVQPSLIRMDLCGEMQEWLLPIVASGGHPASTCYPKEQAALTLQCNAR